MASKKNTLPDAKFPEEEMGLVVADALEIELSSPITHGDETITKLHLRQPTVEDITRIGIVMTFNTSGQISIDFEAGRQYLSRLGAVPPSVINKMTPHDFIFAVQQLTRFFQ